MKNPLFPEPGSGILIDRTIHTRQVLVKGMVVIFRLLLPNPDYTFALESESHNTVSAKGVIFVLVDYRDEIEQMKQITDEGWGRL